MLRATRSEAVPPNKLFPGENFPTRYAERLDTVGFGCRRSRWRVLPREAVGPSRTNRMPPRRRDINWADSNFRSSDLGDRQSSLTRAENLERAFSKFVHPLSLYVSGSHFNPLLLSLLPPD